MFPTVLSSAWKVHFDVLCFICFHSLSNAKTYLPWSSFLISMCIQIINLLKEMLLINTSIMIFRIFLWRKYVLKLHVDNGEHRTLSCGPRTYVAFQMETTGIDIFSLSGKKKRCGWSETDIGQRRAHGKRRGPSKMGRKDRSCFTSSHGQKFLRAATISNTAGRDSALTLN